MKNIFLITCLFLLFSCNQNKPQHHYKEKVHCYKTHSMDNDGNDLWLYYYLFWCNNNTICYYYTSLSPVSNFSKDDWQSSSNSPIEGIDKNQIEEIPQSEVSTTQFPDEAQQEMDTNPENFEGMTESEMGDYESDGGPASNNNNTTESTTTTETGSDAGNSDSGGGGDSGGE